MEYICRSFHLLSRGDKPPSKELLRLFIRTYAVRAGQTSSSPWIVDEAQVKKLDISSKFASFLLSPIKVGMINRLSCFGQSAWRNDSF